MRLNEIEDKKEIILRKITRDCQPFLKRIGNKISTYSLYRGMEGSTGTVQRKKVRLDSRKPMSTAQIKHDRYNNYFEAAFGEPFRNALFVSGDPNMAQMYGDIFAIFPIGNFDWIWSSRINDLALDVHWPAVGGHINVPPTQEVVDSTLGNLNYTLNSNFLGAIQSGNEIMIRCKEYYMVPEGVLE